MLGIAACPADFLWMGSEDGALSLQRDYYSKPTLQGVEDSRSFVSEDWYQPPAELYEVDFENWPERSSGIDRTDGSTALR
ncbi:hypothetical protein DPM13_09395 [Paracoccus mutanolyticus]|uniref:Uncharacterized protein n=1 Tax=Paracoccus mutanolyticus TaxID=1499308 RepID=A0ABM6WRR4_9RHOB|nr:hypothetical protein [Paracoccus mutanolyticus]AWX93254.1 hypothetical protein DPM13_09395 [Paracoccus mutanolyticus]